jgi:hypothetical protein
VAERQRWLTGYEYRHKAGINGSTNSFCCDLKTVPEHFIENRKE